jgi:hypothetical protein
VFQAVTSVFITVVLVLNCRQDIQW